jgi:hypothetical protein
MFGGGGLKAFTLATAICAVLSVAFFPFLNIWTAQYYLSDIGPGPDAITRSSIASGVFFLLAMMLGVTTRSIARAQSARDAEALRARVDTAASAEADQPGFVLFLRPFTLDHGTGMSRLTVLAALAGIFVPGLDALTWFAIFAFVWNGLTKTDLADLERQIGNATAPFGPLVAIGQGEELRRAGLRFESDDENWKVLALNLLRNASLIVMVPAASEGTRWEIDTLFEQGLTDKTVFLFPPRAAFKERADFDQFTRDWQTVSSGLSNAGYQIGPASGADGALMIYPDRSQPPVNFVLKGANSSWTFFQLGQRIKQSLRKALTGLPSMPKYAWQHKFRRGARSVSDALWRTTGQVTGLTAAFVAVAMGIAAMAVGGVPLPLTSSLASGRLINADSIRAAKSFEVYQTKRQDLKYQTEAAISAFLSETGATREQVRLMADGMDSFKAVLEATPEAVDALIETLPETGNTVDVLSQKEAEFRSTLRPFLHAAPFADLKQIVADQHTMIGVMKAADEGQLCVDFINGVLSLPPGTSPQVRDNEVFRAAFRSTQQQSIIAGWRGRFEATDYAPPAEEDWEKVWDQVYLEGLPDTVTQEIEKGEAANLASLAAYDQCALNLALYGAILAQPEERQMRLVPALFPKQFQ